VAELRERQSCWKGINGHLTLIRFLNVLIPRLLVNDKGEVITHKISPWNLSRGPNFCHSFAQFAGPTRSQWNQLSSAIYPVVSENQICSRLLGLPLAPSGA
jgi:hypothetical protein